MLKLLHRLELAALALAALCICAMMLIVSYDAISRYALNAPLPWAFELITYYLMIAALYFAVSMTFSSGDHINIDLFRNLIPPALRARLDALWCLMAAAIFAVIAWGAAAEMLHSYERREFLPGYITWPAWASYLPIALGTGLTVLRLVAHAVVLLIHGEDTDVAEIGETNQ